VLIAEDDRVSRNLLERVLVKWGYEVVVTCDGAEAWEALQGREVPPLAILDWMMPELDGVEVCRRVRELDLPDPPYIILLTARGGKGDIVAGLDAGANDYVGKPFDREELRARLEVGRRFAELNQRLLETQRILAHQARTDALTGSMNRRAVLDRLSQEVIRAQREGTPLGVGMIDIDHFKRVNDTYGHSAGDTVLCEVAARCSAAMRPYDTFGRFGGEEFLAIVPGTPLPEVRGVLERIRGTICARPVEAEGSEVAVSVSIGGATSSEASVDVLIRLADDALYKAKSHGRNRVVMAPAA
jgi:diguanylate cyclase (GGDEF)-like protein